MPRRLPGKRSLHTPRSSKGNKPNRTTRSLPTNRRTSLPTNRIYVIETEHKFILNIIYNIEEILVLECCRNDEILEENKFWNKDLQLTEEDKNDILNNKNSPLGTYMH